MSGNDREPQGSYHRLPGICFWNENPGKSRCQHRRAPLSIDPPRDSPASNVKLLRPKITRVGFSPIAKPPHRAGVGSSPIPARARSSAPPVASVRQFESGPTLSLSCPQLPPTPHHPQRRLGSLLQRPDVLAGPRLLAPLAPRRGRPQNPPHPLALMSLKSETRRPKAERRPRAEDFEGRRPKSED